METVPERAVSFFVENTPSWKALLAGTPPGLLWALGCLALAGWLKRMRGWRTGYTRKVFHFLTFITVALIQVFLGTPAVCLFGGCVSLAVFYAVWRGEGHLLYEAMAREKDAPRRSYYILTPYLATLLGGLSSNILFGPAAVAGYLTTGFGDAIGEPVGTRWGRHRYRVPSRRGVISERSFEGSAAVGFACWLAVLCAVALHPAWSLTPSTVFIALLIAGGCVLIEAVSPHGWDNFTMQLLLLLVLVIIIIITTPSAQPARQKSNV